MGMNISTPGFQNGHSVGFPPEIAEKILTYISFEDKLSSRLVSSEWNHFIITSKGAPEVSYLVDYSSESLDWLVSSSFAGYWNQFTFKNIYLDGRNFFSPLWSDYRDIITKLEFYRCYFFPGIDLIQGNTVICPNLKHLRIVDCNEYFRMGGSICSLDRWLCLENLEYLNISGNGSSLSDKILLSMLSRTKALKSLNLSKCSISFTDILFYRFYPEVRHSSSSQYDFSDNVLTFKMLYLAFLSSPKGAQLSELILDNTNVNGGALEIISDPEAFHWKILSLNNCAEIRPQPLLRFLQRQQNLERLEFGGCQFTLEAINSFLCYLPKVEALLMPQTNFRHMKNLAELLPKLTHLDIRRTDARVMSEGHSLARLPALKILKLSCGDILQNAENQGMRQSMADTLGALVNLVVLDVSMCGAFVTDSIAQSIIRNIRGLRKLNLAGSPVTDLGLAGKLLPKYDEKRLTPEQIESKKLKFRTWEIMHGTSPSYSLSSLKNLRDLNLAKCAELDEATWEIALNLPYLEKLNLSFTPLSYSGLNAVLENCKSLTSLRLDNVDSAYYDNVLRHAEIQAQIKSLPRLRTSHDDIFRLSTSRGPVFSLTTNDFPDWELRS